MRKLILTIIVVCLPNVLFGQTQDENYVFTTVYQDVVPNGENGSIESKLETVKYFDGLGRPNQNVVLRGGGDEEDLITPIRYDNFGRQAKRYLPYPKENNNGEFISYPITPLTSYYLGKFQEDASESEINPFTQIRFEDSPLGRIEEYGAPGMSWKVSDAYDVDHTTKFEYKTNDINEVRLFKVVLPTTSYEPSLSYHGHYAAGLLYKTVTKDENWQPGDGVYGTTIEYVNKLGQTVLIRKSVFDPIKGPQDFNYHDYYYIYDTFGNLTYVLTPEASSKIIVAGSLATNHQDILNQLGYQYEYDEQNRIIEKKVPGVDAEYFVYNKIGQPIFTQDARMRENGEWVFTKYDEYDRVIMTGVFPSPETPETLRSWAKNQSDYFEQRSTTKNTTLEGIDYYYTNNSLPTTGYMEVQTIHYYDTYIDHDGVYLPNSVLGVNTTEHSSVFTTTKGLPTVAKVRVLGTDDWITSLTAYDEKARPVYFRSKNDYLNSMDASSFLLDYRGKPIETLTHHIKAGNATIVTRDYFTYDHVGRLKSRKQKIDNEPIQRIAINSYDELGQIVAKNVGGLTILDGYTDIQNIDVQSNGTIVDLENSGDLVYSSSIKTRGEIPSSFDGGVDLIVNQSNKKVRFGLIESAHASDSYDNGYFDYGLLLQNNSKVYILLGNNQPFYAIDYSANDLFRIERIANNVNFYKNNGQTPFFQVNLTNSQEDAPLVSKVSFAGEAGGSVKNLSLFGPMIKSNLQAVNYKYNIRGWLTDINNVDYTPSLMTLDEYSDLFNFRINYNIVEGASGNLGVEPLYDGNIAQTVWRTANGDNTKRSYGYIYDDLNRIISADSRKNLGLNTIDRHQIYDISYDKNGNIKKLKRDGSHSSLSGDAGIKWDDLNYVYEGNQLIDIQDVTTNFAKDLGFNDVYSGNLPDFEYDNRGNLVVDRHKGITSITYNYLNLPTAITIVNTNGVSGTINYVYDAFGTKQSKIYIEAGINSQPNTTQYDGNYVYYQTGNNGDNILQFFTHPEGYVIPTPSISTGGGDTMSVAIHDTDTGQTTYTAYQYVFQFRDHIGNIRMSYSDSDLNGSVTQSEIIEESNYYPFGLKHLGYNDLVTSNGNGLAQSWKFNGMEFEETLNMELYDLGARFMNPSIGRFMVVDPLTDFINYQSPYAMADNNPIGNVDIAGMGSSDCGWFCRLFNRVVFGVNNLNGDGTRKGTNADGSRTKNISNGTGWDQYKYKRDDGKRTNETVTHSTAVKIPSFDVNLNVNFESLPASKLPQISILNKRPERVIPPKTKPKGGIVFEDEIITADNPVTFERTIKFMGGKTAFVDRPEAMNVIFDLLKTLKDHPELQLLIKGNTSREPPVTFDTDPNKELQLNRAKTIRRFLVDLGVEPSRIQTDYGVFRWLGAPGRTTTFTLSIDK